MTVISSSIHAMYKMSDNMEVSCGKVCINSTVSSKAIMVTTLDIYMEKRPAKIINFISSGYRPTSFELIGREKVKALG